MATLSELHMKKKAVLTSVPLGMFGAAEAREGQALKGMGLRGLQGLPTDLGALLGGTAGSIVGAAGAQSAGINPLLGLLMGGTTGTLMGGYSGYKLSDVALRSIVGEDKYREIFDTERERKVKDKNVVT